MIKKYGNKIKFSSGIKPMVTLKVESKDENVIIEKVKDYLKM